MKLKVKAALLGLVAKSVLAVEVTYNSLIMPTPTANESAPCWSDTPDPICQPDQWLDRRGLIGVASPQPYSASTANNCICKSLSENCP